MAPDDSRRDDRRRNRPKPRSRIAVDGLDRTPHRAFLRATGLGDEAIAQPMIGVATTEGEMTPCNMGLREQAQWAKEGIAEAGGTPREFTTISVSDGIGMNHEGMKFSLVSREPDVRTVMKRNEAYWGRGEAPLEIHRLPQTAEPRPLLGPDVGVLGERAPEPADQRH